MIQWQELIKWGAEQQASDVFFKPLSKPALRLKGEVHIIDDWPVIAPEDTVEIARFLMTDREWDRFQDYHEKDVGLTIEDACRLRINCYQERNHIAIAMRIIPLTVKTCAELDLPSVLEDIAMEPQGFVLVTGRTGCGKSTTLAAMLDFINKNRCGHMVTVEDPIEYVHRDIKCFVSQRAVGIDTESFHDAMKYSMRQSPDIILIGEMRDIETMTVAMQAAETGHLVFSTIHTTSTYETMERIINMFPPHDKPQICMRLSQSLRAVISQDLIPRAEGVGRVAALEIMRVTPTIEKMILEGHTSDMYDIISEGQHWGMMTKNQSLFKLFADGFINEEMAMHYAGNRTEMRQMIRRWTSERSDEANRRAEEEKKRSRLRAQQTAQQTADNSVQTEEASEAPPQPAPTTSGESSGGA
jgi:twitching motility protein PilT